MANVIFGAESVGGQSVVVYSPDEDGETLIGVGNIDFFLRAADVRRLCSALATTNTQTPQPAKAPWQAILAEGNGGQTIEAPESAAYHDSVDVGVMRNTTTPAKGWIAYPDDWHDVLYVHSLLTDVDDIAIRWRQAHAVAAALNGLPDPFGADLASENEHLHDALAQTRREITDLRAQLASHVGELTEHGIELARIQVGAVLRVTSGVGLPDATARVVRMDLPTMGIIEIQPEHQQGQPYRALFSVHNVLEVLADSQPAGEDLWCVHTFEPDKVLAMPSRAYADRCARQLNATWERYRYGLVDRPEPGAYDDVPRTACEVVPWTRGPDRHAAELRANDPEGWLSDDG
jgi:hypothetical protein